MGYILLLSAIGFLLSFYAFYVQKKTEKDKSYKSFCDVSDRVSCTKAFTSGYGNVFFGISNGITGMVFYVIVIILNTYGLKNIVFYLSILSVLGSVYLAYLLNFKVKTTCLICYSIYAVNILLLVSSYSSIR